MTDPGSTGPEEWSAQDRALLRAVLLGHRPEGALAVPGDPARGARRRLGLAIARLDGEAVRALARDPASPLVSASDRLRLAYAAAKWDPPSAEHLLAEAAAHWTAEQGQRLRAALALARPPGEVTSGRTALRLGQGLPLVEGVLARRHRGWFIVDTGAPHSVLSLDWCRRVGLAPAEGVAHVVDDGAGGRIEAVTTRLDRLEAGGTADDVPAIVFAFPSSLEVAGILSPLDAFAGLAVTLDYARSSLSVGPEAVAGPGEALAWSDGVPLLPVTVQDRPAFFLLDSGAGGEVLCSGFARTLDIGQRRQARTLTAAGTLPVEMTGPLAIAVGRAALRRLPFAVKPCEKIDSLGDPVGQDGILGAGWLAGRTLQVDADRRTCRFTDPPDAQ